MRKRAKSLASAEMLQKISSAEIVFILMGANDSAKDVQNVPVAKFSENLTKLVNKARDSGAEKIVLISTPWVDGPAWLKFSNANPESSQFGQSEPNRNEEAAKIYADSGKFFLLPRYQFVCFRFRLI